MRYFFRGFQAIQTPITVRTCHIFMIKWHRIQLRAIDSTATYVRKNQHLTATTRFSSWYSCTKKKSTLEKKWDKKLSSNQKFTKRVSTFFWLAYIRCDFLFVWCFVTAFMFHYHVFCSSYDTSSAVYHRVHFHTPPFFVLLLGSNPIRDRKKTNMHKDMAIATLYYFGSNKRWYRIDNGDCVCARTYKKLARQTEKVRNLILSIWKW